MMFSLYDYNNNKYISNKYVAVESIANNQNNNNKITTLDYGYGYGYNVLVDDGGDNIDKS